MLFFNDFLSFSISALFFLSTISAPLLFYRRKPEKKWKLHLFFFSGINPKKTQKNSPSFTKDSTSHHVGSSNEISPLFLNSCKFFLFGLSLDLLIRFIFYLSTYWFAVLECGRDIRWTQKICQRRRRRHHLHLLILSLDIYVDEIHFVCVYILFCFFRMWRTWDFMEETEDLAEEKEARQADRTVAPTPYLLGSKSVTTESMSESP